MTTNTSDLNLLANLQKPDKLGRWSTPGLNIDIDNLMTSPPKVTTSTSGPSMNQLAQSGSGFGATTQTQFAGPNYNIDTSALMGQRLPPGGMRPGGFGMGPSVGTGMGYSAPGMGYGGVRPMYGMGYTAAAGGYGAQPMAPGGYGASGYSASGYGGMAGPYSNVNPMRMQQRPM